MIIKCESCNAELEVPDSLADGQPVRCPYCHCRFIYASRGREETGGSSEDDRGSEGSRQSLAEQTPVDGSAELWAFVSRFGRHILSSWVSAWKSMFDFGGRMARREYLEFIVLQLPGMALLFRFIGENSVLLLPVVRWIMLFTLISATVRRLHDMNRSGKWLLILIIPIAFAPVRNWLPWIAFGVVVGVGLIRTRGEGNTYSPLQSNRWPLVALILILALGALIQFLTSMVIESVRSERKCDAQMTDVKNVIRQQYENTKEWYNQQLDYNGLREILFTNPDGMATLVFQSDDGQSVHITYMYGCGGMIEYSRSLQKGFAQDLIKARMFIENYEKNEKR